MPNRDVICSVRECQCGFKALVPDKPPRRRDRKYMLTLAKNLGIPFLDDCTVCPKCGNVAKELPGDPIHRVKFTENATADEVSNAVKPILGDPINAIESYKRDIKK